MQTSYPPLHFSYKLNLTPLSVRINPLAHLSAPRPCLMAKPHQLPPGFTAFGKLSAASSPLPKHSSTPGVDYPLAFTAEWLTSARSSLRLNPQHLSDFSQDTFSGLIPSQTATLTLLSQLPRGLVLISQELSGVTQKLTSLTKENKAQEEELHDLSSLMANLRSPRPCPPTRTFPSSNQ